MTTQVNESDTKSLVEDLNKQVSGEVRFDKMSRVLYSTDASIYQIEPIGVVIPRTVEDVIAVVETANRHNVTVLPRGGGTSLAGQTVGQSIVIDFSKYMRNMIEVNEEEQWVRTQPGIVLDVLNHQLRPYGMLFTPDPSTSDRGNIGGALGNNSCGAHSIIWGKTVDNVHEMNVVLSDGQTAQFSQLDGAALESRMRATGLEGDIYRKLFQIGDDNRDEILARYPKIQRRVSGYNLDEFVGGSDFNMARFVVGSEGTLLTITEAKLKLVSRPKFTALGVLHCSELIESMEATVAVLETEPSAVELIGSMILRQAKSNLAYSRITDFIDGDPEAILAIEMNGDTEAEVVSKMDRLEERINRDNLGYSFVRLMDPAEQQKVWDVRKAGLGLMMNVPGDAKPLPYVEDTAVAPEVLPEFVKRFDEIVKSHGTVAGYYGHASVGCLHIRPLIDLKRQDGVDRLVGIAEEISDLVLEFGGSMSGEHGDGLVRSGFNEKMFGTQIYNAFREVKQAFDPKGIMNPGKIVDSPPMTENLRISPAYKTMPVETGFHFAQEGSLAHGIEMCNGQGACRKVTGGTMCPSYMVTRDEEHSTRGRANALRAAMSGALPPGSFTSERMYQVLDLCLECKGCMAECPSNVDMAKIKYEFLNQYHQANGYPLRNQIFGNIAALSKWGSMFAPVSNWVNKLGVVKKMMKAQIGIDPRRQLPEFASQTFTQWFKARGGSPESAAQRGQVVLFPDTFTNYNHPELGRASVKVLEALGYQVIVPKVQCCGRPMLSAGLMDKAKSSANANVKTISRYIEQGVKLVGIEPSCILTFADDYKDMMSDPGQKTKAEAIAKNTMLIEEFVQYAIEEEGATLELDGSRLPDKLMLHGHCHQKALVGTGPAMSVLKAIQGCDVEEIPSGCCGMAGSFGFEEEHFDISMKIGEQTLFPAIRNQSGDFAVVAEGVSCRQQIQDGTGKRAIHLVEVLAEAL
jgi:FAD/FMN-containing dehydrogenase/Fe-S oxidoreductase